MSLISLAQGAAAQVLIAIVPVGDTPGGVAVNPSTNRIYLVSEEAGVNAEANYVSVIDGARWAERRLP